MHDTYYIKDISYSFIDNIIHTLPTAFYLGLGIASHKTIPYIGSVTLPISYIFLAVNAATQIDESHKLLNHKSDIIHHDHEILVDNFVNSILIGTGYLMAKSIPSLALPIIGSFLAAEILLTGENNPTDYLKLGLTSILDNTLSE